MPADPIRVFLVDDHRVVLWGLERLIESAAPRLQLVGSAHSCQDMLQRVGTARPHVVVLDLDLGGEDGIDALPDLLRASHAQVLILTASRDDEVQQRAMIKGARGVVHKSEAAEVFLAAIEKVHSGEIWFNRAGLGRVLDALAGGTARVPRDLEAAKIESLTRREREIIAVTVQNEGACNKIVAARLHISEHTLRNHLSIIYRKLVIRGRIELFIYAAKHGL